MGVFFLKNPTGFVSTWILVMPKTAIALTIKTAASTHFRRLVLR